MIHKLNEFTLLQALISRISTEFRNIPPGSYRHLHPLSTSKGRASSFPPTLYSSTRAITSIQASAHNEVYVSSACLTTSPQLPRLFGSLLLRCQRRMPTHGEDDLLLGYWHLHAGIVVPRSIGVESQLSIVTPLSIGTKSSNRSLTRPMVADLLVPSTTWIQHVCPTFIKAGPSRLCTAHASLDCARSVNTRFKTLPP
jgi:hypothetical protein